LVFAVYLVNTTDTASGLNTFLLNRYAH